MKKMFRSWIRLILVCVSCMAMLGIAACSNASWNAQQSGLSQSAESEKQTENESSSVVNPEPNEEVVISVTDGGEGDIYSYLKFVTGKVTINVSGFANITQTALKSKFGSSDVESITIDGGESGAKIYVKDIGKDTLYAKGNALLSFKNVEFVDQTELKGEWGVWATEFGKKLYFENCTFSSGILLKDDADATFKNCTFTSNNPSVYAFWLLDGKATLENCDIHGTRGIKVHEAGTDVEKITVKNCTFGPLTSKPGFAFGSLNANTEVQVQNCTFIQCAKWDSQGKTGSMEGIDGFYESDSQTTDEFMFTYTGNTVDGVACSQLKKEYNEEFVVVD